MSEEDRLRLRVQVLEMDRQMYADMMRKSVEDAQREYFDRGKAVAEFDLAQAKKTIESLSEIVRTVSAAIGQPVDLPTTLDRVRPESKR